MHPDDLIRVAKRENNQKRSFLYVDPLQGKHIPVSPTEALRVFARLAHEVSETYGAEQLLVIGFSETATAIGAALAALCPNAAAFLTTTREDVPGAEYIDFSESHSHATQQRLAVNGLEKWLPRVNRVVFAEDEVTTGNTIAKLMNALQKRFPLLELHFGIASLLNSMTDERLEKFEQQGIPCDCLARIPFGYRIAETEQYQYAPLRKEPFQPQKLSPERLSVPGAWNQRLVAGTEQIRTACEQFAAAGTELLRGIKPPARILVLGTEECMYPGLRLGQELEKKGYTVRFHATTRSPIEVSADARYPLHRRFPLVSLYEQERRTFVYDLEPYDAVCIVTDAPEICQSGLDSLTGALETCGNTNVIVMQWKGAER